MGLNQIHYPALGQTSNWGGTINRNFKILVDEIEKVNNQAEATKNLVGAGVPYVRQDNSKFFVKIVALNEQGKELTTGEKVDGYRLDYYDRTEYINWGEDNTKSEPKPTISYHSKLYTESYNLFSAIPNFLGAYVLNTITLNSSVFADSSEQNTTGNVEYTRGDYMVRVSSFGSIYSENYAQAQFVLYPVQAGGYVPKLSENPYYLNFQQTNSVDWFIDQNELKVGLPNTNYCSVHAFTLAEEEWNGDKQVWTKTIVFSTKIESIYCNTQYYLDTTTRTPIFLSNNIQVTTNQASNYYQHTIVIETDISSFANAYPEQLTLLLIIPNVQEALIQLPKPTISVLENKIQWSHIDGAEAYVIYKKGSPMELIESNEIEVQDNDIISVRAISYQTRNLDNSPKSDTVLIEPITIQQGELIYIAEWTWNDNNNHIIKITAGEYTKIFDTAKYPSLEKFEFTFDGDELEYPITIYYNNEGGWIDNSYCAYDINIGIKNNSDKISYYYTYNIPGASID